jgi:hypothetical protein
MPFNKLLHSFSNKNYTTAIDASIQNPVLLDLLSVGFDVGSVGDGFVRPTSLSRFMLFEDYFVHGTAGQVLDTFHKPDFKVLSQVQLQAPAIINFLPRQGEAKKVTYIESTPEVLTLVIDTDKKKLPYFGASCDPGWIATVNGKEKEVWVVDYNFMAVELEAGHREVRFQFKPRAFEAALPITYLDLCLFVLLMIVFWFCRYSCRNGVRVFR